MGSARLHSREVNVIRGVVGGMRVGDALRIQGYKPSYGTDLLGGELALERRDEMRSVLDGGVEEEYERLRKLAKKAVKIHQEAMATEGAGWRTRLEAAESVLDRVGLGRQKKVNVQQGGEVRIGLDMIRDRAAQLRQAEAIPVTPVTAGG